MSKNRSLFKQISCMMMAFMMIFAFSITSFAASNADELRKIADKVYNDASTTSTQKQDILDMLKNNQDGTSVATSQQVTFSIDGETFIYAANGTAADNIRKDIQAIYDANTAAAGATGIKDPAISKGITDISTNFKVDADITGATKAMEGFLPLLRGLTGVLAVITILGLGVFTAFDVVYLAFPVAKGKMDSAAQAGAAQGGSMMTSKNHQTGEAKFRLVTDDAMAAYDEATQAGKQPWIAYLKRRWLTYVLCSIIIYILLSGNMAIFVNWALSAISGLIDTISAYA